MRVGRSQETRKIVIDKLHLMQKMDFANGIEADRWLASQVNVNALRGGLIEIDMKTRDQQFGVSVVSEMVKAIRFRLGEISRNQTGYKRRVLIELLRRSNVRLAEARTKYDAYRRETGYTAPGPSLGAIGARVPYLRNAIKAKEMELTKARAFATDNNMAVRQINTEIEVLKSQLTEALKLDPKQPYSINRVVVESTKISDLELELMIAQQQHDSYKFYLEGTTVEDLTSVANIRVLELPYIDTARQSRPIPAAIALLIVLFSLVIEFYLMRPTISDVRRRSSEA
jgi:capsule polysaccharide export protein KpsE/RkpR